MLKLLFHLPQKLIDGFSQQILWLDEIRVDGNSSCQLRGKKTTHPAMPLEVVDVDDVLDTQKS